MISNKKYIFDLWPFSWHLVPKNPWNFLNVKSDKGYANEVTPGKHLRMAAGCQRGQPCDSRVRTFRPTPVTSREGRGTRGWVNWQWPMIWLIMTMLWSLHKNPRGQGFQRASKSVNTWKSGKSGTPGQGMEAPQPFPHTLPYASLPSGCFWVIFFHNTLVV